MIKANTIYNNDFRDVVSQMEDCSVDLIITDPPYKVTRRGIGKRTNTGGMMLSELTSKGKIFKHNDIEPKEYIPELYRVLKDGSHCYIMTNHVNLKSMLDVATDCGFKFVKSLIWDKVNKIMGQYYMSQYEYILFFRKGKGKRINNCGTSDILSVPNKKTKGEDGKNIHDTEKPVQLMQILIENSSNELDIVYDPFMGVGSTAIACVNTGRKFIGTELDENYFNIAKQRIEGAVNKGDINEQI